MMYWSSFLVEAPMPKHRIPTAAVSSDALVNDTNGPA